MKMHLLLCLVVLVVGCAGPKETDRANVVALREVVPAAMDTPAREQVNRLAYGSLTQYRDWVDGKRKELPVKLEKSRRAIAEITEWARRGPDWPAPQPVRIPHADEPIDLDGRFDEPAWQRALTYTDSYPVNETQRADAPATTWRMLWTDEHLLIGFDCDDAHIDAPDLPRDAKVYKHDCMELFILPEFRTGVYWEIVVGPGGSVYDGLNYKKFDAWGPVIRADENVEGLRIGTHAHDDGSGYGIELAVPFAQLPAFTQTPPAAGRTVHFMLVRGDSDGESLTFYAPTPLISWGHNIWNHIPATLVD